MYMRGPGGSMILHVIVKMSKSCLVTMNCEKLKNNLCGSVWNNLEIDK